MDFAKGLNVYLQLNKSFVPNSKRLAEVEKAHNIATRLFDGMEITLKDDPLQLGSVVLRIKGVDIVARGEQEIALFNALTENADNFEIYPVNKDEVLMSIMFKRAFTRIKTK